MFRAHTSGLRTDARLVNFIRPLALLLLRRNLAWQLLNAGAVSQAQGAGTASLDAAKELDPSGETKAGLDVGAMAVLGRIRIGVMVRNLNELEFGSGVDAFRLTRQARAGVAVSSGTRGIIGTATVAVDADLTTTATVLGDERRLQRDVQR